MSETATDGPLWRRLIGFNLLSGIVLLIVGFYFGWWLGHQIHAESLDYIDDTNQNDIALMFGYLFAVIGFLIGLGFARYPLTRMLGRQRTVFENEEGGVGRYFGLCTDHKVVGIQYLFGIGLFFFIAGLNAMLIRAELLRPSPQLFNAGNYLTLVGLHGTMMMGMMTSGILGPFGNYFVPLMIGSRRMAFPRVEALTFWLLMAAGLILFSTIFFGGFPTGWTGYGPLSVQANYGYDSYIFFFALVGISMMLLGLNLITTIVTMRAPGLTWRRLPIFCWGALSTSILMVLAAPVLIATLLMVALDRGLQTSFFLPSAGGSPYLFQNLFWFFGHPEVYVLALPGMGILLEILPVFARKPLWGYRLAVAGLLGVMLLSFFVWQHHLFVSGLNSSLRPFYMFSDRVDLDPDRARLPLRHGNPLASAHPLHGPDALLPCLVLQFLHRRRLGSFPLRRAKRCRHARQLLRHGPFPLHDHGRPRLHILRGDLLLGAEDVRSDTERNAWQNPLLGDVHRLQLHFLPPFRPWADGNAATGGHLSVASAGAERLGVHLGLCARGLDARVPFQRRLLAGVRARAGTRQSVGLQVAGVADAKSGAGVQLRSAAGDRLRPI